MKMQNIKRLLFGGFGVVLLLLGAGCLSNHAGRNAGGKPETSALLHVGDTLEVVFSGISNPPPPHKEQIKDDGKITLPYLPPIQAEGQTPGDLQKIIHDLYVPKYYVHLTVTVSTGNRFVYVTGNVGSPGPVPYVGGMTVLQAIAAAGDFTDFARRSKVTITRANGEQLDVDANEALDNPAKNLPVYPGDTVHVPRRFI